MIGIFIQHIFEIHVLLGGTSSSFLIILGQLDQVWIENKSVYSFLPTDAHLGDFQFLCIINKVDTNNFVQVFCMDIFLSV